VRWFHQWAPWVVFFLVLLVIAAITVELIP